MSIYSNVTEEDMINLRKLVEQQKNQPALKSKNRISKQIHDEKLAGILPLITNKLDTINQTLKQLGEIVKKSDVEVENIQTPAIQKMTVTQSLRDTLALMKRDKNFLKLEEKSNADVFW